MIVHGSYNSIPGLLVSIRTPREKKRKLRTVHLAEVGNLVEVTDVDNAEVLHLVGDPVQDFVLSHAVGVMVATKADRCGGIVISSSFSWRLRLCLNRLKQASLTDNTFRF